MNYETLKAAIRQVITTNGNNEITGALLQALLISIVDSLGEGYQFIGVATPSTTPGTPDQKVFYFAGTEGAYSNFGAYSLVPGELAIFKYDTAWTKDTVLGGRINLTHSAAQNNYKLSGTGTMIADNTFYIRKYPVVAGTMVYLKVAAESPGVFQFQDDVNIYTANADHVIGVPVTEAFEGPILVPEGATYLMVSQLKTNTTNVVQQTTAPFDIIEILSKTYNPDYPETKQIVSELVAQVYERQFPTSADLTAQGYINANNNYVDNATHRCTQEYYRAVKGTTIKITSREYGGYPIFVAVNDNKTKRLTVISGSGGSTTVTQEFTFEENGWYRCNCLNAQLGFFSIVVTPQTLYDRVNIIENPNYVSIVGDAHFSLRGLWINTKLELVSNSNWQMSDPILVKAGQKISIVASDTGTPSFFLVAVNSSEPITSVSDVREFTKIVATSGGGGSSVYVTREWIAPEDTYVIAQYYRLQSLTLGYPSVMGTLAELRLGMAQLVENVSDGGMILPEYAKAEQKRLFDLLINRSLGNVAIYSFNTDQHINLDSISDDSPYNPKWVMQGVQALLNIANKLPIDGLVFGGDVPGYGGTMSQDVAGIMETICYLLKPTFDVNSVVLSIPGNHEAYQNNNGITAQGMHNVNAKRNERHLYFHGNGTDNCDAYYDDTAHNIRVILVDTYSTNVRLEDYRTFLTIALSTMPDGYGALIFSHNPLTNEFDGVVMAQSISDPSVTRDAFQNPSDCHEILNQYASQIIACINGHTHCDAYGISSAGILYIETTAACPHTRNYTTENIPNTPTLNSVTDTSFDFFVIDTNALTIEALRYGQGCNRKWVYKGANIGQMSGYPQTIVR